MQGMADEVSAEVVVDVAGGGVIAESSVVVMVVTC